MHLRQLRTFHAVAELGSLSKASDHLHTASPALSRQIRLLEHELRTTLFHRNGRGMILTDAGRLLFSRVGDVVRQVEQLKNDIVSLSGRPSGSVSLGVVPTASCVLAGRLAQRVARELPAVKLRLVESYGGHLIDWLHRGEIDLAIIYGESGALHLHEEQLAVDELMIVGPPGCRLEEMSSGSFAWLGEQRVVLPSESHGLRRMLDRVAKRKQIVWNIATEADSFHALIDMVERGVGYTVLPPSAILRERSLGTLEAVTLRNPRVPRYLVLARPLDRAPSVAVSAISECVKGETAAVAETGLWAVPGRRRAGPSGGAHSGGAPGSPDPRISAVKTELGREPQLRRA